ncbi:unnamed protein product, partial [Ectocarpus fasciculatus]
RSKHIKQVAAAVSNTSTSSLTHDGKKRDRVPPENTTHSFIIVYTVWFFCSSVIAPISHQIVVRNIHKNRASDTRSRARTKQYNCKWWQRGTPPLTCFPSRHILPQTHAGDKLNQLLAVVRFLSLYLWRNILHGCRSPVPTASISTQPSFSYEVAVLTAKHTQKKKDK